MAAMDSSREQSGLSEADLAAEFQRHRDRLRRMIELRLDARLKGRIDPSDVLQETWLDAARRVAECPQQNSTDPFLWLRFLAGQKLLEVHRRHFQVQARDAGREQRLGHVSSAEADTSTIACELLDSLTPPEMAAERNELLEKLQTALEGLEPLDREILVLRHFEQLSAVEIAECVGLPEWTCRRRYLSALRLLRRMIDHESG
jgi:RNA polymerase sigma-70 factor (ECF subfamily)